MIPPGASANYNIVVTSVTAPFTNPVTLTATGLPAGASYSFTPATVTPGAAGATSSLKITVPKQAASRSIRSTGTLALALLLLPLASMRGLRLKSARLLVFALMMTSLAVLAGCGAGGFFNQPEQTYTIVVSGSSESLTRTSTVTLTVQ